MEKMLDESEMCGDHGFKCFWFCRYFYRNLIFRVLWTNEIILPKLKCSKLYTGINVICSLRSKKKTFERYVLVLFFWKLKVEILSTVKKFTTFQVMSNKTLLRFVICMLLNSSSYHTVPMSHINSNTTNARMFFLFCDRKSTKNLLKTIFRFFFSNRYELFHYTFSKFVLYYKNTSPFDFSTRFKMRFFFLNMMIFIMGFTIHEFSSKFNPADQGTVII